jgi:hypothetical protein
MSNVVKHLLNLLLFPLALFVIWFNVLVQIRKYGVTLKSA